MSYAYTFLKNNGTITGGQFDSDVVSDEGFHYKIHTDHDSVHFQIFTIIHKSSKYRYIFNAFRGVQKRLSKIGRGV